MKFSFLLPVAALSALFLSSCAHLNPPEETVPSAQTASSENFPPPTPVPPAPAPRPAPEPFSQVPARQLEILSTLPLGIIGGTEEILLETIPNYLPAKVDTGADTCSLHASSMKYFERDGKSWIFFQVQDPVTEQMYSFERRIKRRPRIKRHGGESIRRPVVEMKLRFGGQLMKCDFTLTDRSRFEFPVLIGQNLLNGRAAVDVSRSHLLRK